MANTIKLKTSTVASTAPSSLITGELAINTADMILYAKNSSNSAIEIMTRASYFRTQAPNLILAGPTTGSNAAATYRSLVKADMPSSVAFNDANNVFNDYTQSRMNIKDYSEESTNPTIAANALTLNLENGNHFYVTLNSAITTLTISNPPISGKIGSFTLELIMDGTARAISWPSTVRWPAGTSPELTSTLNRVDILTFYTRNAGTIWYGFIAGQNYNIT
jgi:hypothetical protein